jgi:hypothetical protein
VIAIVVMAMFFLSFFWLQMTRSGIFPMRVFGFSAFMPIFLIWLVFSLFRRGKASSTRESFGAGQPVSQFSSSGAEMALGIGRWLVSLIGSVLLIASLLLVFSWLINLPGVIVAIQHHGSSVFEESFLDVEAGSHWPNIVRSFAAFAGFALALVSVIVLMLARRSRGALHMMRALIGAALLFVALFIFADALPHWSSFQISPQFDEWIAEYLQKIDSTKAITAAVVYALGMTMIVWPPKQRRFVAAAPSSPVSGVGKV